MSESPKASSRMDTQVGQVAAENNLGMDTCHYNQEKVRCEINKQIGFSQSQNRATMDMSPKDTT